MGKSTPKPMPTIVPKRRAIGDHSYMDDDPTNDPDFWALIVRQQTAGYMAHQAEMQAYNNSYTNTQAQLSAAIQSQMLNANAVYTPYLDPPPAPKYGAAQERAVTVVALAALLPAIIAIPIIDWQTRRITP